jgi:hypothetical protein
VGFEWAARYLDTASLEDASPEDFVGKLAEIRGFGDKWSPPGTNPKRGLRNQSLACLRREINDVFEPLCRDHCSNAEVHDDDTPVDEDHLCQRTDDICNSRRYHCEDVMHESDANNYDHTQHRICKPRKNIVLLLTDKAKCLRDLKMLGCDPHKRYALTHVCSERSRFPADGFASLHVVDIIDVRELFQAYSIRADYSYERPMTGKNRAVLARPSERLAGLPKIWSALGYDQTEPDVDSYEFKEHAFLSLRAAVDMAIRDATSRQWLRTREQVDGGPFPGPWVHFQSRGEVEAFLIEYDVAQAKPLAYAELLVQTATLKQSLRSLSRSAYDGVIAQLARTHNYTSLLDTFPAPAPRYLAVVRAEEEGDARDTRLSNTPSRPSAEQRHKDIMTLCDRYHAHQEEFETELYSTPVSAADKAEFQSLFDPKSFIDKQTRRAKSNRIPKHNYACVFKIVKNTPGWQPSATLAKALRSTISGHEEAQKFYQRLPASDSRRDNDEKHQDIIDVFKKGEAMLLEDKTE